MPASNEEFLKRLRATFKVEAEEHLQAISAMLLELEKSSPSKPPMETVENIYREAHSLKGAARSVDFLEIETICQAIEGVFSSWKRESSGPSAEVMDTIHQALDSIQSLLGGTKSGNSSTSLVDRLGRLQGTPSTANATSAPAIIPAAQVVSPDVEKADAAQTVRISINKLDTQLLQIEELLSVKSMAASRATEMRQLSGGFDLWRKQWGKVSSSALSLRQALELKDNSELQSESQVIPSALVEFLEWNSDYVRSLENKLQLLSAQAERDRHAAAKHIDDLLDESKKLLMLPFSTIAGVFPKVVRDLCRDQNKEAEVSIVGNEIEMDKRILEEMKDALMHVLRNCVDHGVETPAERVSHNKPAKASIQIAVSQVDGNSVEIRITDDGTGVDIERVKESAVRLGIISQAEARSMSERDAISLVFHSDVSAKSTVTKISGRGLGMAIVRAKAEKLGGHISFESNRQVGTVLRITLPMKLSTFRGVVISAAGCVCVLPTQYVQCVIRVTREEIRTIENRESIRFEERAVSLVKLESVLNLPPSAASQNDAAPVPVVIIQFADQRIAFVVDEVLREEEVLVKPLCKPLARVRCVAGATVLASGKPAPILNVTDLLKAARTSGGSVFVSSAPVKTKEKAKRILVAEDSITSRMLVKGILELAGYQVQTAVDGIDAFTSLREQNFDLVVSDVEMPRMDGFNLAGRIRADKKLADLPIILVTALESPEQRERGIDAGANAYIVKSNFDQSNLLEAVRRLI